MPAKSNHVYDENDIVLLKGLEGVKKRPAMYIGSTNSMGLHHLVWEIVDNAVDEALSGFGKSISVTIHKDGSLSVQDEGRGIPTGINSATGKSAVELVFTELHAGGKFSDKAYTTSAGLHGVGASVTNALSEWLECYVYRDGEIHHIKFANGGKIIEPLSVTGKTNRHGTYVRFKPDANVFSTVEFKWDTIYNRLQESAFLLKGMHYYLKDERTGESVEFHYENGLQEYVATLNANKKGLSPVIYFEDPVSHIKIDLAFQYCLEDYGETIYSYVNNVRTRDGGTHETGFRMGITRAVNDFATTNNLLKKGVKLEGSDIREGLTAIIALKIPEDALEFEGQTKGKLGTPEATPLVNNFMYSQFTYYLNENKEFALKLIKKCVDAQAARVAARKAKEEARNTNKKIKNEVILSGKLTPPQSKDFAKNELFIVEGDSAGGTARTGRDRIYQGILPLRGKPLNTDNVTLDRMLKNEEFATLINTIGAGYGANFDPEDAKYGKIIIMTDADTDGAHIQTLLLTFFYHYMRGLITSGKVYIAVPPLYRVYKYKDKKEIFEYAWDDEGLEKAKAKVGPGYLISRYKGLGEMSAEQLWDTTMNPKTRLLIQVNIEDPLLVEYRVGVLMGSDTSLRKKWVEENVDFNTKDEFMKEVKR
ncbi:MAG: DNA topoisomerase IV subunit B [Erysipelotrichales bacterium]|nr:DNA topoisomerase IV subunit B [Erysipelotrichales bacterium]